MPSTELHYQSRFGNEFATEAVAGALPVGQNSPQRAPLGLYSEQLSGSPFTAPRAMNRRTWTYRIRPSVTHKPYVEYPAGLLRSGPFDEVPTPPNQLRWDPFPIPEATTDFVGGLASGFKEPGWKWSVEKFYHHWFASDKYMLGLIDERTLGGSHVST